MRFKDFIKLAEQGMGGGGDQGLMGFPKASSLRKPSDGRPFKNLGSVAGQEPRGNTGGGGANPAMFMKKKMKKR
jgi:hypothetical protein